MTLMEPLDWLNTFVDMTEDETEFVRFKHLQELVNIMYYNGQIEKKITKKKLIELMMNDPIWSIKMNNCRAIYNKTTNVILRLRINGNGERHICVN